jgi:ubiquitin-protein ligase
MATIIQKKRFDNEKKLLQNEPLHYSTAYPDENDPLIWYFIIYGQKDSPYYNGKFIGKITHSKKYPVEPPSYQMLTPNGRFEVNKDICLTNSNYHKGEWSSTWNIKTILIAFNSIFYADDTTGISHILKTAEERVKFSIESDEYNKKNHNNIYTKFLSFDYLTHDVPVTQIKSPL